MAEMPERIHAFIETIPGYGGDTGFLAEPKEFTTEYVRADIYNARVEALEKAILAAFHPADPSSGESYCPFCGEYDTNPHTLGCIVRMCREGGEK